ncbi:MAG: phosphonate ABC transporter, permease protein PhnE [Actinobacteria bacterium]|nr:phosphonate ABC transporter, permease protein PhnE [Actinomycetota bacterium]MBW3641538.1 phosphonate ABC transporter, permease protein PhnE [Actinomycetota bacterium]
MTDTAEPRLALPGSSEGECSGADAGSQAPVDPPAASRLPRVRQATLALVAVAVFALCVRLAEVDPGALLEGLPKMAGWAARSWPPSTDGLDDLLVRAAETVAIAVVGTALAAVASLLACVPAARNLTPARLLRVPARWALNACRGVDSFVFALLFVAAVGLGPFAGTLGVAFHTFGSMGKLFAEAIEGMPPGPLEAAELTGAGRLRTVSWVVLPDVAPGLVSVALYMLEFNIRASVVLGVVGAGGIGQQLKNAIDLLNFPRLFTIILIILVMVAAVDALSSRLRAQLR